MPANTPDDGGVEPTATRIRDDAVGEMVTDLAVDASDTRAIGHQLTRNWGA